MTEDERLKTCEAIAQSMYNAGLGWNFGALERLTRPEIPGWRDLRLLPEPTPVERGVLDRYQDKRRKRR